MSNKFELLETDDVIYTNTTLLKLSSTFKVREFLETFRTYFNDKNITKLFDQGLELEVLRLNSKGWKKGKLRFKLEFCSDKPEVKETAVSNETESTLDDIRRMIN